MQQRPVIEESKLPAAVRIGKAGFVLSLLGMSLGGGVVRVVDALIPGVKGNGIPAWAWPILIAVWTPGIVGFVLSHYSIARYPYLNLATGGGPKIAVTSRWIWVPLGYIFYLLTPLIVLSLIVNASDIAAVIALTYLAIEFGFIGFLLTSYRQDKHPTIATFLELTFGIGIVFFPIYLPSIVVGTIRCRRFLRSLQAATA